MSHQRGITRQFHKSIFFSQRFTSKVASSRFTADVFVQYFVFDSPRCGASAHLYSYIECLCCLEVLLPFHSEDITFNLETNTSPQDKQQAIEHAMHPTNEYFVFAVLLTKHFNGLSLLGRPQRKVPPHSTSASGG